MTRTAPRPPRGPIPPGKESVWDYPRPPAIEHGTMHVRVELGHQVVAESRRPILIKETSHPPVYYLPPEDVREELLEKIDKTSACEWKGRASYFDVVVGTRRAEAAAYRYELPVARYAELEGWYSFYAGPMDSVTVDGESVIPQEGGFYSGWITKNLVGPFKGAPGTWGW